MSAPPPGVRFEPDPSVTSATRPPAAEELGALDRQLGGIVVSGWTYRLLRVATRFLVPPADLSDVVVEERPEVGNRALWVRPENVIGAGALLLIHGGGYVIGAPTDIRGKAAKLARGCGIPVLCPGYRLAPQHPFPAGLDDVHAAWTWLQQNASKLGVDPGKVVIGGYSAGGGHAAALAQRLRDEGGVQPAGQLLIYPMVDDRTATQRELDKPRHRVWSNRNNLFGWSSYLGQAPGGASPPYAVPARTEDLSGLAPAWVGVGTPDLFLDEDRAYAGRMADAGVDVTYVEVDGGIHAFDMAGTPLGLAFEASMVAFVRKLTA